MKKDTYMEMCIEEIKTTKSSGADTKSVLNFLYGWFASEVKSEKVEAYTGKEILEMIEAILDEDKQDEDI